MIREYRLKNHNDYWEMRVEIDFDDNGEPLMPSLVTNSAMVKRIQELPPPTPEQDAAWKAMMERKRREWNARRRRRRLS